MPEQMIWFFVSVAFGLIAWSVVTAHYIWPELRTRPAMEALRPILVLHSFRYIGLAFLVPGVVSTELPSSFARNVAYGDLVAATLALISLLLLPSAGGVAAAWMFNILGLGDLLNAFYQANRAGALAGQMGAAYFLPTLIVPLLMITHILGFRILLKHARESWVQAGAARVNLG